MRGALRAAAVMRETRAAARYARHPLVQRVTRESVILLRYAPERARYDSL